MKPRSTIPLWWPAAVTAGVILAGGLAAPASARPDTDARTHLPRVDAQVTQALDRQGSTTFWVMFDQTADLSGADRIADWGERGRHVTNRLRAAAQRSQAPVQATLTARGAKVESFWAANALLVTGDRTALDAVASRTDVQTIAAPRTYRVPRPTATATTDEDDPVAWNIEMIHADRVWQEYGVRGEGVTIGVIDTGAQFDHPALVRGYRGTRGDGTYEHGYNWWDPNYVCGDTRSAPCDNNGHGTHVTGTVLGDAGPGNRIGVAPGATWIAAKGCEYDYCSDQSLLSSMQWMLAPTDRYGRNPRPELRPQVVNNSWGNSDGAFEGFRQAVRAWAAAGVMPVFAAGNSGPTCATVDAPGSYPEAYTVGAHDREGTVAPFSARGSSPLDGGTKPDLSAPGSAILSSVPGNGYAVGDGTSMATPHVTGTVALILAAAPKLRGELPGIRAALDASAVDTADTSCGGTSNDNNVYGEGRLDAAAAVALAPRDAAGVVTGVVTDATTGAPVPDVTVGLADGQRTDTEADGSYRFVTPAGRFALDATGFGYRPASTTVEVPADGTIRVDLALVPVVRHTVTGRVADPAGAAVFGVEVTLSDTPLAPVKTAPDGGFRFEGVPEGRYRLLTTAGACVLGQVLDLTVDGDETPTITAERRRDGRGYGCHEEPNGFRPTDTTLPITGTGAAYDLALPFPFRLYGKATESVRIHVDGRIATDLRPLSADVLGSQPGGPLPDGPEPDGSLYPYWADLFVDGSASVRTGSGGISPHRWLAVEWRNVRLLLGNPAVQRRITVQAVLSEDGTVRFQYAGLDDAAERGAGDAYSSVSVGIEDEAGSTALPYTYRTDALTNDRSIVYTPPAAGLVFGRVTDHNDGRAVDDVRQPTVSASDATGQIVATVPVVGGVFGLALPDGRYTIEGNAEGYAAASSTVEVVDGATRHGVDLALTTARIAVSGWDGRADLVAGQQRVYDVRLTNSGGAAADVQISTFNPSTWLRLPDGRRYHFVTVGPGETVTVPVTADSTGLSGGEYAEELMFYSATGREPRWTRVPVHLTVAAYEQGIDAGGAAYTDLAGGTWAADQPYAGQFGYEGKSRVVTTTKAIAGTDDDTLYQTCRVGAVGYRFAGLPSGNYELELEFAEINGAAPGKRRFDVYAGEQRLLAGYDIAGAAGRNAAARQRFTVAVTGGELHVRLVGSPDSQDPMICGLRATHRPFPSA
ncbi:subtilisin family serine protease [Micromonospora pisi]|uniref:Subtilisin family serine protease n=1 Tax=Micromonospora pisi TaxID=589240 RepID=A0A495JS43_9ACTN|nr:S8 family serine peptidase [Micromonospora pisi]RKR91793.1 subtilisin family serine protease [Micromonospora pisi]